MSFQSTLPVRGATPLFRTGPRTSTFQSTLPVRGGHAVLLCYEVRNIQSRSPGGATCPYTPWNQRVYFNPRSQAGGLVVIVGGFVIDIQSTLAGGEHFALLTRVESRQYFNPRSCGSDAYNTTKPYKPRYFNHAPRAGATAEIVLHYRLGNFNQRSRAGATTVSGTTASYDHFNPRPVRGATSVSLFVLPGQFFFNQAPRAGSAFHFHRQSTCQIFQSTLPVRGATFFRILGVLIKRYFNPRSPCGERL